jgi:hypothetical protein
MKTLMLIFISAAAFGQGPPAQSVETVLAGYVKAVGGQAAVDAVNSREVHGATHHGPKLTYYWQKPNKVFFTDGKQKIGYDGGSGWQVSRKKKLKRLPLGAQIALEMDANPLRYVYLKSLYTDVSVGAREALDGKPMDVLVAPNNLGATKFYFDAQSHLLCKLEETGEVSAYFKNTAEFSDYKPVDGILFPFRITHTTTAVGGSTKEFHVSKVRNNIPVKPEIFEKPQAGAVIFGGKR